MAKKFLSVILICILSTAVFVSCSKNPVITDPYGKTTAAPEQTSSSGKSESEINTLLPNDESWKSCYALTYDFYDSKEGSSTITEYYDGEKYISADAASGIITYIVPAQGYLLEYFLDTATQEGTVSVVSGSSITDIVSGFYALSVTDRRLPAYSNTQRVGRSTVAGRSVTQYLQTGVYSGGSSGTVKIFVDDVFGFTSKLEFSDASRQLLLSWELKGINTDASYVKENMPEISLDSYKISQAQA